MSLEPTPTSYQINIFLGQQPAGPDYAVIIEPTATRGCVSYAGRASAASVASVGDITSLDMLFDELEEGYKVLRPIPVSIRKVDTGFVAGFEDAHVSASGDTWAEAALNLKSLVVDTLDMLLGHRREALGPGPKRQLSVLQSFIRKTGR